ncbi:MAG: redoxin domain-containing protein [Opitutaceae bacterium]
MKRLSWLVALAAVVLASRAAEPPAAKFGTLVAGNLAPDVTALGVDGKVVKLSDFKGKTVVLNFWANNRGPAEALELLASETTGSGVVVWGICSGATRAEFDAWVKKSKGNITYLLAWDAAGKTADGSSAAAKFGVGSLPATGVIGRDGKIVGGITGFGAQSGSTLRGYLRAAGVATAAPEKPETAPGVGTVIPAHPNELKPGAVAPDFTAIDATGRAVKLSDFAGKIVVLDFWATWCAPCLASFPHAQQIAAATKAQGVLMFAACTSDTRAAFQTWTTNNAAKYPDLVFANDPIGRDTPGNYEERASVKLYGVSGLPTVFVIGRDGKIAEVLSGYGEGDTRLEEALQRLGVALDPASMGLGK